MNQHPSSQGLARQTLANGGDLERIRVLRIAVIPTTRTIQQRGDTQDTVVIAADGRTFLVRRHTRTVSAPCPLGSVEIRRVDAETTPRM